MTTTSSPVTTAVGPTLDIVSDHAVRADRERRLPAPVVEALAATGINRMALPPALDGAGAHPWALFELVERIATVDGSAAWCAAIAAGTNVFAGYLTDLPSTQRCADRPAAPRLRTRAPGALLPNPDRTRRGRASVHPVTGN